MAQVGSAAEYHDEENIEGEDRPSLRAVPLPDENAPDDGFSAAVRGLIDSVNVTARGFADAAEGFARETIRVMEGFVSRAEGSLDQSRDMAGVAGKAAEDARGASDALEAAVADARDHLRGDIESMIGEIRPQLDDAVRAASEALAAARQSAGDVQEKTEEAYERIEQSLTSSREAASSAEAAAEAARRSAESVEQAAAEARAGLREEARQIDSEAAARIEQSVAASTDAAGAAQRAAEDARVAALEAMSHAAEAKQPQAGSDSAATRALLDRLEADYQLITELIEGLNSRINSLDYGPAPTTTPSVAAAEAPAPPSPPDSDVAAYWRAALDPAGEAIDQAVEWAQPEPAPPAVASETMEAEAGAAADATAMALSETSAVADWQADLWQDSPPAAPTPESTDVASAESPGQEAPQDRPLWSYSEYNSSLSASNAEAATGSPTGVAEPAAGAPDGSVLSGRIVLTISPVPDFDRLLSLDTALGRLPAVSSVTLADYAREEVTFRVELAVPVTPEEFEWQLEETSGQTLEVVSAVAGELQLQIVRAAP